MYVYIVCMHPYYICLSNSFSYEDITDIPMLYEKAVKMSFPTLCLCEVEYFQ